MLCLCLFHEFVGAIAVGAVVENALVGFKIEQPGAVSVPSLELLTNGIYLGVFVVNIVLAITIVFDVIAETGSDIAGG
jgi:hypothetical protein